MSKSSKLKSFNVQFIVKTLIEIEIKAEDEKTAIEYAEANDLTPGFINKIAIQDTIITRTGVTNMTDGWNEIQK